VVEHVGVVAPGVLEGVGQDRQPVEGTVGVDAFGEGEDGGREPRRIDGHGPEGVPEDIPDKPTLCESFFRYRLLIQLGHFPGRTRGVLGVASNLPRLAPSLPPDRVLPRPS
jgi:hypothetical protein